MVTGAARGAGRAIAVELGAAGATVYVTGRSGGGQRSPMDRTETIEESAALVDAAGGTGIAVRVDHAVPEEVAALTERIATDHGRLDILVNDIWGGDRLTEWEVPFWEHDLGNGIDLLRGAIDTHIITSWHAAPLLIKSDHGVVFEVTDGVSDRYRGTLFYDLAKFSVSRLARAQAEELRPHNVAAIAISPGFLRSETMLELFDVTETTWREAIAADPHFAFSETPHYLGRAIAALAADDNRMARTGTTTATWELFAEYGFTDLDGTQPDWGTHMRDALSLEP